MKNNVRRLTDGAMIVALMGLLLVLDAQSGMILDGILFWAIPIPIIVYMLKYDLNSSIIVSVAVTLLSFMISLPHIAILVGFSTLIGLAYGYGVNKGFKVSQTLSLTFIVTFGYYLISMILFAGFFGYDALAEIKALVDFFTSLFNNISSSEINAVTFLRWTNPFFAMLIMFVPFLPALTAVLQTLITHIFSSLILKRLKLAEIKIKPFYLITVDKKIGIISLVLMILTYAYFLLNLKGYDSVIILVQFISQLLFIVMGAIFLMSVVVIKANPLYSIIVALLVIAFPLVVMAVGIFDVFSNYRINMLRRAVHERENRTT